MILPLKRLVSWQRSSLEKTAAQIVEIKAVASYSTSCPPSRPTSIGEPVEAGLPAVL